MQQLLFLFYLVNYIHKTIVKNTIKFITSASVYMFVKTFYFVSHSTFKLLKITE